MKSILAGRGVLTPPILWRPPPRPTRTLFQILSTPSPVPCYLQPLPPLLFLLSCFFRWMGDRAQGRIRAVFDTGNRFWAHKNRCPNFDRSTKVMILILFNSRYIDLNNETHVYYTCLLHELSMTNQYCSYSCSIYHYHSFALMISFISIFLEWLMFSYFLIRSFITAKRPKKFCSHWVGEFYPSSCMYYRVKTSKVFYLCLLWCKSLLQIVTKCANNSFF